MSAEETIKVVTSILSSLAAVVGVFVASYGALMLVPRELSKWKAQKRAEQRATTAAKALNSALRLIDALLLIGNPFSRSTKEVGQEGEESEKDGHASEVEQFNALFSGRLALVKADMDAFKDARDLVTVFLDEEQEQIFTELEKQWTQMLVSGEMHAFFLSHDKTLTEALPEAKKAYEGFFQQQERLKELRKRVITSLRPIARMDDEPPQNFLPKRLPPP